jgi:hypothetical protein
VREGHRQFLDKILMLMRFGANNLHHNMKEFSGDYDSFMALSRSDPRIASLNSQIFTMYRVKPVDANYPPGTNRDKSLLVNTIETLLDDERMSIDHFGEMACHPPDGVGGRWMVRNFARFLQSWDKERISGIFWIVKICPTGTLIVKKENKNDDGFLDNLYLYEQLNRSVFGKVYLVKGMGSIIGENNVPLPSLVRMTILPLYDFLVHDGILSVQNEFTGIREGRAKMLLEKFLKRDIQAHVERAVREETIVFCGESASKGLWSDDPPEVNLKEIEAEEEWEKQPYEPSQEELEGAMNLARYAQSIGFKSLTFEDERLGTDQAPLVCVCRLGYTIEDNPSQRCGLRFNTSIPGYPHHNFGFKQWPTYTIMELLPELLEASQTCQVAPGGIWMDEQSLVIPMRSLLKKAFQEIGFDEEIQVKWFPPVSKEEQTFNSEENL